MPTSSKRDYLAVLQQLIAFAEGDTLTIPIPLLQVGDGLLTASSQTNTSIVTATAQQRKVLQKELQHYLRGIANGHAAMIEPYSISTTVVTNVVDPSTTMRRRRSSTRVASYLINGTSRDWMF